MIRPVVLAQLLQLNLKGLKISEELPYLSNGQPLYEKNARVIYVSESQYVSEPFLRTMQNTQVTRVQETITLYFGVDAKKQPADYDTWLQQLRLLPSIIKQQQHLGIHEASVTYDEPIVADMKYPTLQMTFTTYSTL